MPIDDLLFCDFETRSPVDIKRAGADVYARHPKTKVMAFGYAFGDEEVLITKIDQEPEPAIIDHIANGGKIVAHNAHFEWLVWNYVWRKQWVWLPELKIEQCLCTMSMSYSMAMPGSLEFAAAAAGLDMQKDTQGVRIMLQLALPKAGTINEFWEPYEQPEKFSRMYKYCSQDVGVERELYKRLMKLSIKERELYILDHKINQRGVQIDLVSVKNAIQILEKEKERLDKEMQKLTNGAVVTCQAVGQLKDFIRANGFMCEGLAKDDIADLLANEFLPEICRKAILLRQEAAKSSNAKLTAMLKGTCEDGRSRGLFQYHGASTGRWAGRRIQLQNLPRPKLSERETEAIFNVLGEKLETQSFV